MGSRQAEGAQETRRDEGAAENRAGHDRSFPSGTPDFGGRVHELEQESSGVRGRSKESKRKESRGGRGFSSFSKQPPACENVMPFAARELSELYRLEIVNIAKSALGELCKLRWLVFFTA